MGPDGTIWFTEQLGNKIGVVSGIDEVPVTNTRTNVVTGDSIQVATPGGTTQLYAGSVTTQGLNADPGYSYPLGLVTLFFRTPLINNQVTMTFITPLTPSQVVARNFNLATRQWTTIPGATIAETTLGGKHALQLTYSIANNGPLDAAPSYRQVNDPVALGVSIAPSTGLVAPSRHTSNYLLAALAIFGLVSAVGFTLLRRAKSAS